MSYSTLTQAEAANGYLGLQCFPCGGRLVSVSERHDADAAAAATIVAAAYPRADVGVFFQLPYPKRAGGEKITTSTCGKARGKACLTKRKRSVRRIRYN